MWYILIMNKEVIYIEPEDDITDIITKIENSKEKIVALVPPKKAGVFRSAVNIKLIAKASTAAEKKVVLVTVDPSIVKLAATAKIPVTKDLKTAPVIPEEDEEAEGEVVKEELVEESDGTVETEEDVEELDESPEEREEEKKEEKKKDTKKDKKAGKAGNNWFKSHKKIVIFGGIGLVLLIVFLVWAFGIAPAATITVDIRTTSANFSENVTFTTKLTDEKTDEGVFYLEEKKNETENKVEFEATGKKNVGEKASGEIKIYAYFPLNISASSYVNKDDTFTISGLEFKATESVVLNYDGQGKDDCVNKENSEGLVDYGCRINGTVPVVATEPGAKYNIAASSTGWSTNARVFAYSDEAMSGGTDEEITVVQQSDIDKAKTELAGLNQDQNKEKLLDGIKEDMMVIDSSFSQSTSDAVSTPAVGEEVKDGKKATLKATTTASIYVLDKTKVEQFILSKAKLDDDQKIYEMHNPFVENFLKTDAGFAGKLKTSYSYGPKITENEVIEITKGKGLGVANHDLKDINGVADVHIDPSYPWVSSVPNDANKITVVMNLLDNKQ